MLTGLFSILTPIVDKVLGFIPNPLEREKAKLAFELEMHKQQFELLKLFTQNDASQIEVNKIEAASEDKFKSYWRPAIAWVCVAAYSWMYVLQPLTVFILNATGHPMSNLPQFDLSEMTPILMGMLGLAGLRTWEKTKGK